jgi:hypothetical protein
MSTGFYIGGDIGWSDLRQNATTTAYPTPGFGAPPIVGTAGVGASGNLPTAHTLNGSGILGGAVWPLAARAQQPAIITERCPPQE